MAVSLKKQAERATARVCKCTDKIFALATNGSMRFSDCLALADAELIAAYEAAKQRLTEIECEGLRQGKAYIDPHCNHRARIIWHRGRSRL